MKIVLAAICAFTILTSPLAFSQATGQVATPLTKSETDSFRNQANELERRAKAAESLNKGDKAKLTKETKEFYATIKRRTSQGVAAGGNAGAKGGSPGGRVECVHNCEFENSQCKQRAADYLCDVQAALCLLACVPPQ